MKTKINHLLGAVLSLLVLPLTTNAATGPCATHAVTQVYDLKTDWSDTQNPNGPWSYRWFENSLLANDPFPWVGLDLDGYGDAITRTTADSIMPGYLELGDVSLTMLIYRLNVRWTAPANGTINISGTGWNGTPDSIAWADWTVTHNGSSLSSGDTLPGTRAMPDDFSSGSGGAAALQNIPVAAGDQVELAFTSAGGVPVGVNFTITLTTDSNSSFAEDAIIWHQPLARSGMSEDTDPSAGRTIKYRFKRGSTIPIQIHALDCAGADVASNSNIIGTVTVFGDSNCDGAMDANATPIEFNGVGAGGGVMDKIGGHLKYNLDTNSLPATTLCYIVRVTVTDTSTGEEKFEEVLLQAK